jgi:starch synthase (maltosyl-transferring)
LVDDGDFAVKRCEGDLLEVEADIFADGHETLAASLLVRSPDKRPWQRVPMEFVINDRWRASFPLEKRGVWQFRIEAWLDDYRGFVAGTEKKKIAGVPVHVEIMEGHAFIAAAQARASGSIRSALSAILDGWDRLDDDSRLALLTAQETRDAMRAVARGHSSAAAKQCPSMLSARAPGSRPGTSFSRDHSDRAVTERFAMSSQSCPASGQWASTSSICRPSILSVSSTGKAATMR